MYENWFFCHFSPLFEVPAPLSEYFLVSLLSFSSNERDLEQVYVLSISENALSCREGSESRRRVLSPSIPFPSRVLRSIPVSRSHSAPCAFGTLCVEWTDHLAINSKTRTVGVWREQYFSGKWQTWIWQMAATGFLQKKNWATDAAGLLVFIS